MVLSLDTDFSGGNAIIERINGRDVYFRPDLRDTEGHWFYWCLRVRASPEHLRNPLRFHLTSENTLTEQGPAVSLDRGRTWSWLGPQCLEGDWSFTLTNSAGAEEVRLSMAMPYTYAHWEAFVSRHLGDPGNQSGVGLRSGVLCQSSCGRPVPKVLAGCLDRQPKHRVLLTARHHACEMMASYALEGLLDAILTDDELKPWFQQHVQVLAIPFVDIDGVEAGDQGKNRRPRDHNRDYDGESIYPETAAIRRLVPQWAKPKLDVMLDLHCPWIRSAHSQVVYLVGSSNPDMWQQQCAFSALLERHCHGPLPYAQTDNLPFGQRWNVASNSSQGRTSTRWGASLPGTSLVSTVEIPYALAKGHEVTAHSARAFGHDLARALQAYLSAG